MTWLGSRSRRAPSSQDLAGPRTQETGDRPQHGGLAGAVRPHHAEDLARLDGERDAPQRGQVAVRHVHVPEREEAHAADSTVRPGPGAASTRARMPRHGRPSARSRDQERPRGAPATTRRVERLDLGVADGSFARIAPAIAAGEAARSSTRAACSASPAWWTPTCTSGIYAPLAEDAVTESQAAAMGGVTTSLNYIRTGQYYLNRGGPYARLHARGAPALGGPVLGRLRATTSRRSRRGTSTRWSARRRARRARRSRSSCSTAATGCTAADPTQSDFLMIGPDERYDIAHFEFIMRGAPPASTSGTRSCAITSASACTASWPKSSTPTRKIVEREGKLTGLRPTARRGRRTPKGWRSGSPPISPTRPNA